MINKKSKILLLIIPLIISFVPGHIKAVPCPVRIITGNGAYSDSSDWDVYLNVVEVSLEQAEFTFHNENLFTSSIARIYLDDDFSQSGVLSNIAYITEGPGTEFSVSAKPGNLPAGKTLDPPFDTTGGFSLDADPSPAHNGINPGQWLSVAFYLQSGFGFDDVLDHLLSGQLRVGAHVIALPDGSSESAIFVPEPATIFILGLSFAELLRKRKRSATRG